jgi:DNA polymerase-4
MGHGKVVPPNTRDKNTVYMYLIHMAEKVASRLRSNAMQAQKYFIGLKCQEGWLGEKLKTTFPTNDSKPIIKLCKQFLTHYWQGQGVFQVQVTALDPHSYKGQIDLFGEDTSRRYQLNRAMDLINERYGEFTVAPMPLLDRSTMPNVIAPAWKPYGHRQTIPSTKPKQGTQTKKKVYRLNSD